MFKITNIAFGDSLCNYIENSKFSKKDITIKFYVLFSIGKITNNIISYNDDFYNLIKQQGIYEIKKNNNLEEKLKLLNDSINNKHKIRIWTTHKQIDAYLMLLYICNYLANINYDNVYVLFSDEHGKEFYTPSCMEEKELEKLLKYEHKLTKKEINDYSKEWLKIVNDNSDMRIINNNKVESVSFNYYDNFILDKLKELGEQEKGKLMHCLMIPFRIYDTVSYFLVNRLLKMINTNVIKDKEYKHSKWDNAFYKFNN